MRVLTCSSRASALTAVEPVVPESPDLLDELVSRNLILREDWEQLGPAVREEALRAPDGAALLELLVETGLLTRYQANRVEAGSTFGLVLGNYRVLERIGAGGMGVVFKAEHIHLRRPVAVKVMPVEPDTPPAFLARFAGEVRAIARLVHPNIVTALDAGVLSGPTPDSPSLRYLVMEYVAGADLEEHVRENGPLAVSAACAVIGQVATALAEAGRHGVIHRDVKPSNVILTPEGQAKLLDFGLARSLSHRVTEPGVVLGTIDYMSPEQVRDPSTVDARADLYALGGTLYWCLTGKRPFPSGRPLGQELTRRLTQPPPSVRDVRPEVPAGLDAVVQKLMATNPADRYPTPEAARQALARWVESDPAVCDPAPGPRAGEMARAEERPRRVLVVDDEPSQRELACCVLQVHGIECDEAAGGREALEAVRRRSYDALLLDLNMPDLSGLEVCRRVRAEQSDPYLKILTLSGYAAPDDMAQLLLAGADDFLVKPFSVIQLQSRVLALLRQKQEQERTDRLNRQLLGLNQELEQALRHRDDNVVDARNALVLALARLVEYRDDRRSARLGRLRHYIRVLAEEAARLDRFGRELTPAFIEQLCSTAPLLDLGKVGLPDHILLNPGKLTAEERLVMQTHTVIGAEVLAAVAEHHTSAKAFLQRAAEVARHHHERFDGTGYPDGLRGSTIPLAARLVAPCDVYDALRSRRLHRPGLPHSAALQVMAEDWDSQFDPGLRQPFVRCASRFDAIFHEMPD